MTIDNSALEVPIDGTRFDNLPDWLRWQEGLHLQEIELGLDRCLSVAKRLGLLAPAYRIITVGGTNGKGSSVAMLDAILRAQGYRVGTYTSPHLLKYNERVRVNGEPVSDAAFCMAFERVERARGNTSITYFEFGTLAALVIFHNLALDVAVLEVGLGGRLDAVNCLDADVALLAAIGLDHTEWLGPDRDAIGREKAGIFRPNRPAVCSDPDVPKGLLDEAMRVGCNLRRLNRDFTYEVEADGTWHWTSGQGEFRNLPRPRLLGQYQYQNASGVLMALQALSNALPVSFEAVCNGLSTVELLGRFTIIPGPVAYILDVAHNPQAASVLADNLTDLEIAGATHAVIGMLRDKDRVGVFQQIQSLIDYWHVVDLPAPRGAPSAQLAAELAEIGTLTSVNCYETVDAALLAVRSLVQPGDCVLVTGSFLTVSAAMRAMTV